MSYFLIMIVLASEPRDCLVSEWSGWAGCSKTCGIGETVRGCSVTTTTTITIIMYQVRTRTVTQQPVHGGRHCPSLRDYKWCGSARNCKQGEIQTNSFIDESFPFYSLLFRIFQLVMAAMKDRIGRIPQMLRRSVDIRSLSTWDLFMLNLTQRSMHARLQTCLTSHES